MKLNEKVLLHSRVLYMDVEEEETRVLTGPHTQVRPRRKKLKVDRQVEEVA